MATNNMHNLTTLIKRLEAATSRLEDMAASTIELPKINGAPTPAPTGPLPSPPAPRAPVEAPKPVVENLPESIEEFDAFITGPVKKFVNLSDEIGGPLADQASSVLRAFVAQRRFILITTRSKKLPIDSPVLMQLLKPLQESITTISEVRETNHKSPQWNQLSAISESISVLAWVTMDSKPHKHIEESLNSAQFWGNRVLKEFKDKDPKQVEWIKSYYQVLKDLMEYAKTTFPQGIPWNPKGVSAEEAIKALDASSPPPPAPHPASSGGPPPPPPPPGPPPPPMRFDDAPKAQGTDAGGLGAVFSELNKGEAVTKGLKKVSADQMTHKNPSLRAGATVPTRSDSSSSVTSAGHGKSPAPPGKKPKPEAMRTKKPPVKKLDGNKWIIENYDNESKPVEIEASISHSILISRCNKTTIVVKGKANAISIDNSPRLSIIIDSLVSSIDVIKSTNFALQVMGTLPTILLDSVDGATIYLGKDSLGTEVFSSKCSSINLSIPEDIEAEDTDYKECPLPEQIRTWVDKDGKVLSEIVEHAG